MTPTRAACALALAAAMGVCGAISARAESFTVTKLLRPTIAETQYQARVQRDTFSCWPLLCIYLEPFPAPVPQAPFFPDVLVGFDYFGEPGTGPCACEQYFSFAYRAAVMFRPEDIPHCDQCVIQTATLTLEPQGVQQKGNVLQDLIGGLFEVSYAQAPTYDDSDAMFINALNAEVAGLLFISVEPGLLVRYAPSDGRIVLTRRGFDFEHVKTPVIDPFPFRPGPTDSPVSKKPGFDYRIDVTSNVKNWIADLSKAPSLRGFVIAGLDESLPTDQKSTLLVEYFVRLEVVYSEPVR